MSIQTYILNNYNYPDKLLSVSGFPKSLYYLGNIALLDEAIIAVIGKRESTSQYLSAAEEVGATLADNKYVILNGLAMGCDAKAIEGALSQKGKVVAVLPGGLDVIYPKANRTLAERILDNDGLLISEYPSGTEPQKYTFIERDRIQAALANKIIVIDSEIKGGTMHTVKHGLKLDKSIGCMVEIDGVTPAGNRYLCDLKRSVGLKNMEDVLNFVKEPIGHQMNLFCREWV